jgi:hypothetical protein
MVVDMNTPKRECYVLRYLALIDMERAQRSLGYIAGTEDSYLKDALFRDAVVSYVKPFSDNRGLHTKKGLKIGENGIPKALKAAHKEIVEVRNQLFAHMDLDKQVPHVEVYYINGEKQVSFTVKGYERVYTDHLVGSLVQLAKSVHCHLMKELQDLKRHV